jgi:crotonobetaine/carnitine-CoA ligase
MDAPAKVLAWSLLETRAAAEEGGKDFLRFHERAISYRDFADMACDYAARFAALGVVRGEVTPTFFPNGAPAAASWFALMRLGAIWAPINSEFRGAQLVHALTMTGARRVIVDARYLNAVAEAVASVPSITEFIVHGAAELPAMRGVKVLRFEDLPERETPPIAPVDPAEVAMIQFTSGSTGVSKAVQLSHGYLVGQAELTSRHFDMCASDVVYCPFPLYHWDATIGTVMGALVRGATAALADRFSVSRFWDDVRAFKATMFDFMGATLTFLYERPPTPRDRDHCVRLAWGLPMPDFRHDFEARFGFPLLEGYGSTEGGVCVFQELGAAYPAGSCGKLAPEFELKLIKDDGSPAAIGEVGEIVTRPHDPTLMMSGYLNMPEVNAELIRDGWYYSGDLGRLDAEGYLYFAGRKKDIIRRRGENISALEIEREVARHPAVLEAAAFGAPSPFTEEDVAVAVVLRPGMSVSEAELKAFCEGRMARYMRPEHVLFLDALPKTVTQKVAKADLKAAFAARAEARSRT